AMAPMDDPQISMIVIVYRPTKVFYGNFTAGPIVKEIMEKSLQYLGVERQYSEDEEKEVKSQKVKVPDVTGMNSKDAINVLKNSGLKYIVMPESNTDAAFVVLDQYPKKKTKVDKGSTVYLYSE
ncbi:MAG: PASTA domain-containing protein, partial [Mogibacterium sp.]|nr:PASTA domain-containing protein [Mogibacterium sp.]